MKKEEAFIERIVERDDMFNGSRSSHCCAKRVEE